MRLPILVFGSAILLLISAAPPSRAQTASPAPATTNDAPPATTAAAATPTPTPAVREPTPIKNAKMEFSTRTDIHPCTSGECTIDTFVVAKKRDNGDLDWERRIYYRKYEFAKDAEPPVIPMKTLKFVGGKMIYATNARGDTYELETVHGHMKKPKSPKEYKK